MYENDDVCAGSYAMGTTAVVIVFYGCGYRISEFKHL